MDLGNAFHAVNCKFLPNVILDLGFRGVALELMSSYLSNRNQRAGIDNQLSSRKNHISHISWSATRFHSGASIFHFIYN